MLLLLLVLLTRLLLLLSTITATLLLLLLLLLLQGDCDAKMSWFLPRFEAVLRDPESAWGDWQAEYTKVCGGA
jgi:hypothetical protein